MLSIVCTGAISSVASHLKKDNAVLSTVWPPSGCRLVCHCFSSQHRHADVNLGDFFRKAFGESLDRDLVRRPPPTSAIMDYFVRLREEPPSDSGSSADEGVAERGAGWEGDGRPMTSWSGPH